MSKELPSDDEVRAALRRSRPYRSVEVVGCVVVLACAAAGGMVGLMAFNWVADRARPQEGQPPPRIHLLISAGILAGLAAGVLAFQLLRRLTRRLRMAKPR